MEGSQQFTRFSLSIYMLRAQSFTQDEDGRVQHRAASENRCRSSVTLEALYPLDLHLYH